MGHAASLRHRPPPRQTRTPTPFLVLEGKGPAVQTLLSFLTADDQRALLASVPDYDRRQLPHLDSATIQHAWWRMLGAIQRPQTPAARMLVDPHAERIVRELVKLHSMSPRCGDWSDLSWHYHNYKHSGRNVQRQHLVRRDAVVLFHLVRGFLSDI